MTTPRGVAIETALSGLRSMPVPVCFRGKLVKKNDPGIPA
jgi:hypothetical protein